MWVTTTRRTSPSRSQMERALGVAQADRVLGQRLEDRLQPRKVDRPITLSSSLVAVCCSRATRSSLLRAFSSVKRRTFSSAITACSANVWSSVICLSLKGRTSSAPDRERADGGGPPERNGHGQGVRTATRDGISERIACTPDRGGCLRGARRVESRIARPEVVSRPTGARVGRREGGDPPAPSTPMDGRELELARRSRGTRRHEGRLAEAARHSATSHRRRAARRWARQRSRAGSPVAVCCSSASVRSALRASSSLNSRTFSIAMTAWSANV